MSNHYEIVVEIHRPDEDEALAVARELSKDHAATVTVYRVSPGRSFADPDERVIVGTVEPA